MSCFLCVCLFSVCFIFVQGPDDLLLDGCAVVLDEACEHLEEGRLHDGDVQVDVLAEVGDDRNAHRHVLHVRLTARGRLDGLHHVALQHHVRVGAQEGEVEQDLEDQGAQGLRRLALEDSYEQGHQAHLREDVLGRGICTYLSYLVISVVFICLWLIVCIFIAVCYV